MLSHRVPARLETRQTDLPEEADHRTRRGRRVRGRHRDLSEVGRSAEVSSGAARAPLIFSAYAARGPRPQAAIGLTSGRARKPD